MRTHHLRATPCNYPAAAPPTLQLHDCSNAFTTYYLPSSSSSSSSSDDSSEGRVVEGSALGSGDVGCRLPNRWRQISRCSAKTRPTRRPTRRCRRRRERRHNSQPAEGRLIRERRREGGGDSCNNPWWLLLSIAKNIAIATLPRENRIRYLVSVLSINFFVQIKICILCAGSNKNGVGRRHPSSRPNYVVSVRHFVTCRSNWEKLIFHAADFEAWVRFANER